MTQLELLPPALEAGKAPPAGEGAEQTSVGQGRGGAPPAAGAAGGAFCSAKRSRSWPHQAPSAQRVTTMRTAAAANARERIPLVFDR